MAGALRKDPAVENWAAMRSNTQKYFRINRSSGIFLLVVVGLIPAGLGYLSYQTHGQIQLAGLRKTESFKREWPKPASKDVGVLGGIKEELKQFVAPQPRDEKADSKPESKASGESTTSEILATKLNSVKEEVKKEADEFVASQPNSETSIPAVESVPAAASEIKSESEESPLKKGIEEFLASPPSSETSVPLPDELSKSVGGKEAGSDSA